MQEHSFCLLAHATGRKYISKGSDTRTQAQEKPDHPDIFPDLLCLFLFFFLFLNDKAGSGCFQLSEYDFRTLRE